MSTNSILIKSLGLILKIIYLYSKGQRRKLKNEVDLHCDYDETNYHG